jgi:hypothetical protein
MAGAARRLTDNGGCRGGWPHFGNPITAMPSRLGMGLLSSVTMVPIAFLQLKTIADESCGLQRFYVGVQNEK